MKTLRSILCLLLVAALLCTTLLGCKEDPDTPPEEPPVTEQPPEDTGPYVLTENYLPEAVFRYLKSSLQSKSGFSAFSDEVSSDGSKTEAFQAVSLDIATITNCRVKSISIPVIKTLTTDEDKNFTFTIFTIKSDLAGLRSDPVSTHKIKISSADSKLAENDAPYRYVKVDLESYGIELAPGETLAFGDPSDTVIAAYVVNRSASSEIARYMKMEWGWCGHFSSAGTSELRFDRDILCFDLVLEKTYENKAAYEKILADEKALEDSFNEKVKALKDAGYRGKKLSLMGDSISTCDGVTNNHLEYNRNLEPNRCYYWKTTNICDWTLTYWGRLAVALDMDLCVINSWSSSKVYGGGQDENDARDASLDNMLERADQLHKDNNTDTKSDDTLPDVIIIYMGINDIAGAYWCDLADRLNSGIAEEEIMQDWIAEVKQQAAGYAPGDTVVPGTTYTSWQASYALGIDLIQKTYPNAEVWLMTLLAINGHNDDNTAKIAKANECIKAIANYFDVKVIDQANGYITKENSYLYGHDEGTTIRSLHPNIQGMELMMRVIVEEMYRQLP